VIHFKDLEKTKTRRIEKIPKKIYISNSDLNMFEDNERTMKKYYITSCYKLLLNKEINKYIQNIILIEFIGI